MQLTYFWFIISYSFSYLETAKERSQLEGRNHKPNVIAFKTNKINLSFRDIKMHNKETKF